MCYYKTMITTLFTAKAELSKCLFCTDKNGTAPCTAACPAKLDPAERLLAMHFDVPRSADGCTSCGAREGSAHACESACVSPDRAVAIRDILRFADGIYKARTRCLKCKGAEASDLIRAGSVSPDVAAKYGLRVLKYFTDGLSEYTAARDGEIKADADSHSQTYPCCDFEKCVGCGRCYITCRDFGHAALDFDGGFLSLDTEKCGSCGRCIAVCPLGAITWSA